MYVSLSVCPQMQKNAVWISAFWYRYIYFPDRKSYLILDKVDILPLQCRWRGRIHIDNF